MTTLIISPDGKQFGAVDEHENIIDVTTLLEKELYFYNTFSEFMNSKEIFLFDDQKVEDIFYHIAEKVYLTDHADRNNHRLNEFEYTNELTDNIKNKLLIAFTQVFLTYCEKKLGQPIQIEFE